MNSYIFFYEMLAVLTNLNIITYQCENYVYNLMYTRENVNLGIQYKFHKTLTRLKFNRVNRRNWIFNSYNRLDIFITNEEDV